MDLARLKDRPVEWLRGGPEDDVVVSSRVRLARNVEGYPFVGRASPHQKARIEEVLRHAVLAAAPDPPLEYVRLDGLDPLTLDLLVERRLVSREHAEADWVRGVAFDDAERISVMVNEEDHLRIQFVRGGLCLEEVYDRADAFDDLLSGRVPFAFSPQWGYLTACPTNVGTGLRASVMFHLPGLVMAQEMDRVLALAREERLTLRGVYGEGTHGAGDFYQLSNHTSLGPGEEELVSLVLTAARTVARMERDARTALRDDHPEEFRRRIEHAFRLLRSARTISSEEALSFISQVRMGVETGQLTAPSLAALNDLLLLTLPAHLQTMEGRVLDSSVRNELRATYVRNRLAMG
ncbi:MAG: ATP--guanido phosphotransferase [Candidatus Brocadiaceae bacterium]|nr:ATP--guanido phosphotransferase [Candidatus Brocadiaceae bacterium]